LRANDCITSIASIDLREFKTSANNNLCLSNLHRGIIAIVDDRWSSRSPICARARSAVGVVCSGPEYHDRRNAEYNVGRQRGDAAGAAHIPNDRLRGVKETEKLLDGVLLGFARTGWRR
jgi:hypothetical protein